MPMAVLCRTTFTKLELQPPKHTLLILPVVAAAVELAVAARQRAPVVSSSIR